MREVRTQEGVLQQGPPDPGAKLEATDVVTKPAEVIIAPAGNACTPAKDTVLGCGSDLLHVVSREEALLAMKPALPPA